MLLQTCAFPEIATEKNRIAIDGEVDMSAVGGQKTPAEELRAYNERNAANPRLVYKGERCPDAQFCRLSRVIWTRGDDDNIDAVVIAGPDLVPEDKREQITVTERLAGEYTWHAYFVRYVNRKETQSHVYEHHVAEVDLIARDYRNRHLD
ncbi:8c5bca0f-79b8-4607-a25b-8ebcb20d53c4 [Sclerotinia trifoliorum]|uniref:8c5bca0f-79b8-4607-a25b-8ebcb20d53c4 n=1 Tax=Sclerotinia trifoliorum TaxID=28548 RepID=A0A8H2VVE0_9HELO|nr:8c5bca0f-79b8-4607-a25b-8ebcb20d53c4 [Sclerotinia trifoliorum]